MGRKNPHNLEICVCYQLMCFTVWIHIRLMVGYCKEKCIAVNSAHQNTSVLIQSIRNLFTLRSIESDSFQWNCFRTQSCLCASSYLRLTNLLTTNSIHWQFALVTHSQFIRNWLILNSSSQCDSLKWAFLMFNSSRNFIFKCQQQVFTLILCVVEVYGFI